MPERYCVQVQRGQSGPVAFVLDRQRGESLSCYSRKAYGARFKRRAQDDADSLNASDARVAFNAAHDDLLPYVESRDYQRDMED